MLTARTAATAATLATAAVLLAGCGNPDTGTFDPSGGGTTTPTTAATTPSKDSAPPKPDNHPGGDVKMAGEWAKKPAKRKVQKAYIAFQQAYNDAAAIPDPNYQPWVNRMTPEVHKALRRGVVNLRQDNLAQKGVRKLHPVVLIARPTKAVVQDCVDQSATGFYRNDKLIEQGSADSDFVPLLVKLERKVGGWVVWSYASTDQGQCQSFEGDS